MLLATFWIPQKLKICSQYIDALQKENKLVRFSWIHQVCVMQTNIFSWENWRLFLDWFYYLFFFSKIKWHPKCYSPSINLSFHMQWSWIRTLHWVHKNTIPDNCKTADEFNFLSSRVGIQPHLYLMISLPQLKHLRWETLPPIPYSNAYLL